MVIVVSFPNSEGDSDLEQVIDAIASVYATIWGIKCCQHNNQQHGNHANNHEQFNSSECFGLIGGRPGFHDTN